ncbi:MAG: lipoate--protein ligase [Candidatus Cloacimonadaceae bacterium]|jgi:lipoate-protein ligase A|nr:lipoate--protein ligase [Candidatus Cloacimonadota bacterium]MDD5625460.1 lipoate--protein ligase [Candidatus Cloacimonadota bacterium]MDY0112289.1 lipoate--protein ligase [Candidatus Syntrophosphaera sp.]
MLFINSLNHYAPFNIACEEYILNHFPQDVFFLYRNDSSIIVGRHQNTLAEINLDYVKKHNIPVVRRLTGGGTVFHDLGNLNYCFLMNRNGDEDRGFARYTAPILAALKNLGIDAKLEGRNDLTIKGMKFSGNAKAVYSNKVHQHGTILFSSKITDLSAALKANPLKFKDKAVHSVAARVTNISEHLLKPVTLEEFIQLIQNEVLKFYPDSREYRLTAEDEKSINTLMKNKYETWEWNFGHSPAYNHIQMIRCPAGTIEFHTDVHKGKITGLRIYGDFFGELDPSELELALIGLPHRVEAIRKVLETLPLNEYFGEVDIEDILTGLI